MNQEWPGRSEHSIGDVSAPVELLEYGDYECRLCARAHFEVVEVLRQMGDLVRFTFRHFPVIGVHPHALLAAQAAEAAGAQGRFWAMHSMLLLNHHELTPATFATYATTLGLDTRRFSRELTAGVHVPRVTSDLWCGARAGVATAPSFFINGVRLEGACTADRIGAIVRTRAAETGPA
jgi:protein-disulfide isomerase